MEWNVLYYGDMQPSRARETAINTVMATALLGVYGFWTDFVPTAAWSNVGLVITLIFSGTLSIWLCRGFLSGDIPFGRTATTRLRRGFALCLIPPFVFCLSWVVIVRSIPDLLTRWKEPSAVETVMLRKGKSYSRRSCDNKILGEYLGFFPGHVCVSNNTFYSLPDSGLMMVRGSTSVFGVHIHSIEPAGKGQAT